MKLNVIVNAEIKDNKVYYSIDASQGINLKEMQAVLVGGLNLSIKGEKTPELQYQTFKNIVRHMESELFNDESFKDIHIKVQ